VQHSTSDVTRPRPHVCAGVDIRSISSPLRFPCRMYPLTAYTPTNTAQPANDGALPSCTVVLSRLSSWRLAAWSTGASASKNTGRKRSMAAVCRLRLSRTRFRAAFNSGTVVFAWAASCSGILRFFFRGGSRLDFSVLERSAGWGARRLCASQCGHNRPRCWPPAHLLGIPADDNSLSRTRKGNGMHACVSVHVCDYVCVGVGVGVCG